VFDPERASEVYELETPKDLTHIIIWIVALSVILLVPILCWKCVKQLKRKIDDKLEDYGIFDDNVNSE